MTVNKLTVDKYLHLELRVVADISLIKVSVTSQVIRNKIHEIRSAICFGKKRIIA